MKKVDEGVEKLLKSMKELAYKLSNNTLENKERKKLEREWDLKFQKFMNYAGKLEMRLEKLGVDQSKTSKKLQKEWRTIILNLKDIDFEEGINKGMLKLFAEEFSHSAKREVEIQSELDKEKSIPNYISKRWTKLSLNRIFLKLLEDKLFKTKRKVEYLERRIEARSSINLRYPFDDVLLFNGIRDTHPEIFYFLLSGADLKRGSDFYLSSKYVQPELKYLEILIRKENEENGYIKKQHNSFLDKVNNYDFKTSEDKQRVISFLTGYYNIEVIKERISTLRDYFHIFNSWKLVKLELESEEEVELKEKQEYVKEYEPQIKKFRKTLLEEFEELMDIDFYKGKSKLNNDESDKGSKRIGKRVKKRK